MSKNPENDVTIDAPNAHIVAYVKEHIEKYVAENDIQDLSKEEKKNWVDGVVDISEDTIAVLIESLTDALEPVVDDDDLDEADEDQDG